MRASGGLRKRPRFRKALKGLRAEFFPRPAAGGRETGMVGKGIGYPSQRL